MDQLKKRGRHLANRFPLCGKDEENIDHLLLLCTKIHELRALLFTILGINWVLPWRDLGRVEKPLCKEKLKKIWLAAPFCTFWIIWREKNKAVFEDVVPSAQRMKNSCLRSLVLC